jgi:hypothetical protein
VIAQLNTPARRIAAAIALSMLVHAAILWLPDFQFPHPSLELPPLSVRLEALPAPRPADKTQPANAEPASPLTRTDGRSSAVANRAALPVLRKSEQTAAVHPFPRHLQLTFKVHQDGDESTTGKIRDRLDIHGDRYTLRSERRLAGLRSSEQLIRTSSGKMGEHGLQPDTFDEEDITRDGKQVVQATFDWGAQKLRFADGSEVALPEDAQDMLSFIYQISQLPLQGEYFEMPVSDGEQLQQYRIEIGTKQDLDTPVGKLRTLYLRKIHAPGEGYFEIWLGLQYRMLPVKFRLVDGSEQATEEYVISDIRAEDK